MTDVDYSEAQQKSILSRLWIEYEILMAESCFMIYKEMPNPLIRDFLPGFPTKSQSIYPGYLCYGKGKKHVSYFRLVVSVDISPLLHTKTIDHLKGPQPTPEAIVNMSFLPGLGCSNMLTHSSSL